MTKFLVRQGMPIYSVEIVQYNQLYEFIQYSESIEDYVERLHVRSSVIILELAHRLEDAQINLALQLVPLIDEMNEEVTELVDRINRTEIIENQVPVMNPLLFRLMEINNDKLYQDYKYAKTVMVN